VAIEADVTNSQRVRHMVEACQRIDILVNNAGVIVEQPFLNIDEAEWDHVLNSDLNPCFYAARPYLPAW